MDGGGILTENSLPLTNMPRVSKETQPFHSQECPKPKVEKHPKFRFEKY